MKTCLNCEEEVENDDNDYCEACAFERLKKYIKELYEHQEKNIQGKS